MNADQRSAALARCEAATGGPWDRQTMQPSMDGWHQMTLRSESVPGPAGAVIGAAFRARLADAEFIAHARTDLPAALAEIERLRSVLAELARVHRAEFGYCQADRRTPAPCDVLRAAQSALEDNGG